EELLIDFQEILGKHSGENMVRIVWDTMTLYGLEGQVMAIVMDNASNNDTLMEYLEERCTAQGIYFSAKESRMRCMPHTIHLA
ncbi:hypothetical protein C8J56DRAFT_725591, partial [Mycena floridula]